MDAHRFEALAGRGRDALDHGDPHTAGAVLGDALRLWRGPALADLAEADLFRPAAVRLDEARLAVVEELAEAELALGHAAAALARLEPHVAAHPLRERAWGQRMVALYRLGRQADALRAYQDLRRLLGEELGLEPTPALRRLEQRILLQSPELEGAAPTAAEPAAPREPAETVAFLFTDIEASTRRWEGDQDAMAADLDRHDEVLTAAVEAAGGQVFSHTGDGLCAAFPTASAALAAALAGQQALLRRRWAGPTPLRVRMAVHAGAAERGQGTYLGPTLNRTARLLALAAGGQVLCSQAAAELARDRLPAGVTLLDLGDHRLADLSRPERVYQLPHPELPAELPGLRCTGARATTCPWPSAPSSAGRGARRARRAAGRRPAASPWPAWAGRARPGSPSQLARRRPATGFPTAPGWSSSPPVSDPALRGRRGGRRPGHAAAASSPEATAPEEWLCDCLPAPAAPARARQLRARRRGRSADLVHLILGRLPGHDDPGHQPGGARPPRRGGCGRSRRCRCRRRRAPSAPTSWPAPTPWRCSASGPGPPSPASG